MTKLPLSSEPDPREWLRFAHSDLNLAMKVRGDPDILPHTIAFHAQQAVEKAIKAMLIHARIRFPFTHDLAQLFELYRGAQHSVPVASTELEELTPYAGHRRYPGWIHQPGPAEVQRLISLAEKIVAWAEAVVNAPPPTMPSAPPE